jgi:hypothetical protein
MKRTINTLGNYRAFEPRGTEIVNVSFLNYNIS